jgi:hypothetical protein
MYLRCDQLLMEYFEVVMSCRRFLFVDAPILLVDPNERLGSIIPVYVA